MNQPIKQAINQSVNQSINQSINQSYIHTYIPTYLHTYIHTYVHTYIHTYIRTYIHTYIQTKRPTNCGKKMDIGRMKANMMASGHKNDDILFLSTLKLVFLSCAVFPPAEEGQICHGTISVHPVKSLSVNCENQIEWERTWWHGCSRSIATKR